MLRFTSFGSKLRFPVKSPTLDEDLLKVSSQKFSDFMCSSLCKSHTPIVKRQNLSIYRTIGFFSFPFVLAASTSDVVPNFPHIHQNECLISFSKISQQFYLTFQAEIVWHMKPGNVLTAL
jgi:hypothetical protein